VVVLAGDVRAGLVGAELVGAELVDGGEVVAADLVDGAELVGAAVAPAAPGRLFDPAALEQPSTASSTAAIASAAVSRPVRILRSSRTRRAAVVCGGCCLTHNPAAATVIRAKSESRKLDADGQ